jgi:hypothetical protein
VAHVDVDYDVQDAHPRLRIEFDGGGNDPGGIVVRNLLIHVDLARFVGADRTEPRVDLRQDWPNSACPSEKLIPKERAESEMIADSRIHGFNLILPVQLTQTRLRCAAEKRVTTRTSGSETLEEFRLEPPLPIER